jgi:hypothetical protein
VAASNKSVTSTWANFRSPELTSAALISPLGASTKHQNNFTQLESFRGVRAQQADALSSIAGAAGYRHMSTAAEAISIAERDSVTQLKLNNKPNQVDGTQVQGIAEQVALKLSAHSLWMLQRWKARALGQSAKQVGINLAPLRHTQQQIVKAELKSHQATQQPLLVAALAQRRGSAGSVVAAASVRSQFEKRECPPSDTGFTEGGVGAHAVVRALLPLIARNVHTADPMVRATVNSGTDGNPGKILQQTAVPQPLSSIESSTTESKSLSASPREVEQTANTHLREAAAQASVNHAFAQPPVRRKSLKPSPTSTSSTGILQLKALIQQEWPSSAAKSPSATAPGENHVREKGRLSLDIPTKSANDQSATFSCKPQQPVSGKAARVLGFAINALQRTSPAYEDGGGDSSSLSGFSESESE